MAETSKASSKNNTDFTFFWTVGHVNGWASQWYPAPFTAAVTIDSAAGEELVNFPTTEHWMMLHKALLFSDHEIARQIVAVTSAGNHEMKRVKALGRKVQNFDDKVWNVNRKRIVLEGNLHKFRQNGELRRKLLATGDTEIVEASPMDRIWGIGFGEKNALENIDKWGMNLLGKVLEETRRILREEEAEHTQNDSMDIER
ncbi:hypothetical protein D9615_008112 [Tricholomella constricta]|uniref:NADAR domain-containing protein n=1 Tax=Tricholomella constricta TaxID=117010 RepID=A0A8H5LWB3_9AGAR|nr:hypothetical protein D9615_008112 [Tricholomella constricta]